MHLRTTSPLAYVAGSLPLLLSGCGANEAAASRDDAIVGGQIETRYPGAGYLVARIDEGPRAGAIIKPYCSATLIAPNAVLTTASCVSKDVVAVTIVGVGFGAVDSGPLLEPSGRPFDWIKPNAVDVHESPDGERFVSVDARNDIAFVTLKASAIGVEPLQVNTAPIAPNTAALAIGYGRVVPGNRDEAHDSLEARAEDSAFYPATRKSVTLDIEIALNQIYAYPQSRRSTRGGACFGDFGAPLLLADGKVAGLLADFDEASRAAAEFDGKPLCSAETGGEFVNLRYGGIPEFLRTRLAVLPAVEARR